MSSKKQQLKNFKLAQIQLNSLDPQFIDKIDQAKLSYYESKINKDSSQDILFKEMNLSKMINPGELECLKNMTIEEILSDYLQITGNIIEKYRTQNFKQGTLQVRSFTLKIWKNKFVRLDKRLNLLMINEETKKNCKLLKLQNYTLVEAESDGGKFCFYLKSLSKENRYKSIKFGSVDQQIKSEWFKEIQSSILQYGNNLSEIKYTEELDANDRKLLAQSCLQQQNSNKNIHIHISQSPEKLFSFENNPEEIQSSSDSKESHFQKRKRHQTKSLSDIDKVVNSIDLLKLAQQNGKTLEEEQQNILDNQCIEKIIEENGENGDIKQNQNSIELTSDDLQLISEQGYKLCEQLNALRILQQDSNHNSFKVKLSHQCETEKILNVLNRFEMTPNWNQVVEDQDVIKVFDSSLLYYQKNKSHGMLYYPRDFIINREVSQTPVKFVMKEKSVNYQENEDLNEKLAKRPGLCQRGHILKQNWHFYENLENKPNNNMLIVELEIENNGLITQQQNQQMTLSYLKSFSQLEYFITQQIQLKPNPLLNHLYQQQATNLNNSNSNNNQKKQNMIISNKHKQDSFSKILQSQQEQQEEEQKESLDDLTKLRNTVSEFQFSKKQWNQKIALVNELRRKSVKTSIVSKNLTHIPPKKQLDTKEDIMQDLLESQLKFQDISNDGFKTSGNDSSTPVSDIPSQIESSVEPFIYEPFLKELPQEIIEKYHKIIQMVSKQEHFKLCLDQQFHMKPKKINGQIWNPDPQNPHLGPYSFDEDYKHDTKRGILEFNNKPKIKNQEKVLGYILKTIGKNIFTGKSLINVSMPVFIFEKRSNLERSAQRFTFAPHFLQKAANKENPLDQMKLTMSFVMSNMLINMNLEKPFNPILGETYQAEINGDPLYMEQISHHPPIQAYQYYGKGFTLYGNEKSVANLMTNSVIGGNIGITTGSQMYLEGTAYGQRTFNQYGVIVGWDFDNDLFCEIFFNPDKKGFFSRKKPKTTEDSYKGGIYQINKQFKYTFNPQKLYSDKGELQFKGLNLDKDVVRQLSECSGVWHDTIRFDDKEYWQRNQGPHPFTLQQEEFPLPSNCNFREDILYMKLNDQTQAQTQKEKLENIQRADKKLRKAHQEKLKKSKK